MKLYFLLLQRGDFFLYFDPQLVQVIGGRLIGSGDGPGSATNPSPAAKQGRRYRAKPPRTGELRLS